MKVEKKHIDTIIRVNQAGEYGAVQIYKGQRAMLKGTPLEQKITAMLEHEEVHLQRFNALLLKHRARPTFFSPLWHVGGFALGALTALMGGKAALACTVAVEEVIESHYEQQKRVLDQEETLALQELKTTIQECQAEEVLHKNIALELGAQETPFYGALTYAIKTLTKGAIWLSKRL